MYYYTLLLKSVNRRTLMVCGACR